MIFRVWQSDYDNEWTEAVYLDEALAKQHADEIGGNYEQADVLLEIHPDVVDPDRVAARAAARDASAKQERKRQEEAARAAEYRRHYKPVPPFRVLCSCATFRGERDYFTNTHGYCSYCGGVSPGVFRSVMGDDALLAEIDKLELHRRKRMCELCALPEERPVGRRS